jgi:hypothetical protein
VLNVQFHVQKPEGLGEDGDGLPEDPFAGDDESDEEFQYGKAKRARPSSSASSNSTVKRALNKGVPRDGSQAVMEVDPQGGENLFGDSVEGDGGEEDVVMESEGVEVNNEVAVPDNISKQVSCPGFDHDYIMINELFLPLIHMCDYWH